MNSRDYEERILDAIENQFRTEDPQLIECFSDFDSIIPGMEPVESSDREAPGQEAAPRGRHRRTNQKANAAVTRLVLRVIALIVMAMLVAIGGVVAAHVWH